MPSETIPSRREAKDAPDSQSVSALYVPWWLLLGAVVFSGLLFCSVWVLVLATRGDPAAVPTAAPLVHVTPAPPPTEILQVTAPPGDVTQATPTATVPPPPPGSLQVGGYAQVVGTGGDGLSLRVQPGINNTVNFLGLESEIFVVRDGPVEADGYTWWYLVNPYDDKHNGWAVQNFLQPSQGP